VRHLVHLVGQTQDVVGFTRGQQVLPPGKPVADRLQIGLRDCPAPVRADIAGLHVDDRDLVHLDPALAVSGIDPEHRGAIFADAEVVVRQICHRTRPVLRQHYAGRAALSKPPRASSPYRSPAQKVWMRRHASSSAASEVA